MVTASILVAGLSGCDALIGIEDLSTPGGEGGNAGTPCQTPSDCPDTGDPCVVRACTSQGICELREAQDGPVPSDPVGDCLLSSCLNGGLIVGEDPADFLPDGNACTTEGCGPDGPTMPAFTPEGEACAGQVGLCDGGGNCFECLGDGDCSGGDICIQNVCASPDCENGALDGDETDIDCGGDECPKCEDDSDCDGDPDCLSGVCEQGTCQAPSCDDGTPNGDETDVDCGGLVCEPCDDGDGCVGGVDCVSGVCADCEGGTCQCSQPTCTDMVENGTEIDVDCGPDCLGSCVAGQRCQEHAWCFSFNCDLAQDPPVCLDVSCEDGIENGDEEGTDCGGSCPDPCPG